MMKKITQITLFIFFILCFKIDVLMAQEKAFEPEKTTWKWYRSKDKTCEIRIPTTWEVEENFMEHRLFVKSTYFDKEDHFLENLSVFTQKASGSPIETQLRDYAKRVVEEMPKIIKDVAISEPRFFLAKNKLQFCEIVCSSAQDGVSLKWKQLFFIKNNQLVTLTFTAEKNVYRHYEALANVILFSFDFVEK
jgi:hypothetical protein